MPTAVLAGAFGQRNPGDDALLLAFARALDGWDLIATAARGAHDDALAGCEPVAADDPLATARAVGRADAVILAGGTVFKVLSRSCGRRPGSLLRRAIALTAGARALGKPVLMVGVGAGALPTSRDRALARALVGRADLLVLRDEESAAVLEAAGAPAPFRVGADAAWTLFPDAPPAPLPPGPDAGVLVSLSHHAAGSGAAGRLAEALAPIVAAGVRVVLQPFQVGGTAPDDLELGREVSARLGGVPELELPPADLCAARDRAREAGAVVALRFHAALAAAAAGTPFVAYAHEPKLAAIARRLGQPAVAPSDPPAALGDAALAALGGPGPAPALVKSQIAHAEEAFRLMELVLARGRRPADDVSGLPLAPRPWRVPEEVHNS